MELYETYLCVFVSVRARARVWLAFHIILLRFSHVYRHQWIFPLTSILQYKYTKYFFTLLLATFAEARLWKEGSILTSRSSLSSWLARLWISYVNFRSVGLFASSSAEFCRLHVHPIFRGRLQQRLQLYWRARAQPWAPARAARLQQHRHQGCSHPSFLQQHSG